MYKLLSSTYIVKKPLTRAREDKRTFFVLSSIITFSPIGSLGCSMYRRYDKFFSLISQKSIIFIDRFLTFFMATLIKSDLFPFHRILCKMQTDKDKFGGNLG